MKTLHGEGFALDVPPEWLRREGEAFVVTGAVGALQISTALHATEARPTVADLRDIIQAMAETKGLAAPIEVTWFELDVLRAAVATYHHGDDFIRVYSVSDGRSYALATYACRLGNERIEAGAVEQIVRSLRFLPPRVAS